MRRSLLRSNSFVRSAKRFVRKNPGTSEDLSAALRLLTEDAFHPLLKTHKLKVHARRKALLRRFDEAGPK